MGIGDWGLGIGDWGLGIGPSHDSAPRATHGDGALFVPLLYN